MKNIGHGLFQNGRIQVALVFVNTPVKGATIFYREGGGVFLWSQVGNFFWSPLSMRKKILVSHGLRKNSGSPLWKNNPLHK